MTAVADLRVTYDKTANAAYVYLTDPQVRIRSSRMYPCDPVEVGGMINLDFDEQGRLIGIEVLAADSKLPEYLLESSERLDAGSGASRTGNARRPRPPPGTAPSGPSRPGTRAGRGGDEAGRSAAHAPTSRARAADRRRRTRGRTTRLRHRRRSGC
ncbi:DUF2283 domain-containing protein [Streptomyces sp. NPDC054854]